MNTKEYLALSPTNQRLLAQVVIAIDTRTSATAQDLAIMTESRLSEIYGALQHLLRMGVVTLTTRGNVTQVDRRLADIKRRIERLEAGKRVRRQRGRPAKYTLVKKAKRAA